MIARVATFDNLDPDQPDPEAVELLRTIVRSQPGFRAGYHMRDPRSGKALSVVVFRERGSFSSNARCARGAT